MARLRIFRWKTGKWMIMSRLFAFTVLVIALALGLAAAWLGNRAWDHYERGEPHEVFLGDDRESEKNGPLSLQELLQRLSLPEKSRILEIELERHEGVLLYEIELLTPAGTVKEILVDPRTGQVMGGSRTDEEEE